jgi:anti-sigma-K factor RskA
MKLSSPALIDHLASQYVLGQLSARTRRRFETYLSTRPDLRTAVARWESSVHSLAVSVPHATPSADVWNRIEARLFGAARAPSAQSKQWVRSPSWWQRLPSWMQPVGLVAAGALGALAVTQFVLPHPSATDIAALNREALPQSYVGLLLDNSGSATLLASSLRQGKTLTVKLLKPIKAEANQQFRLWAMPSDGVPFSVGIIPTSGSAALPLSDTSEKLFFKVPRLIVVAEPVGSANTAPSGTPVLSGHCVKLW